MPGLGKSRHRRPDTAVLADKLHLLEVEEIRLHARLLQLRDERVQIHAALAELRTCIDSLPPELLLKIFSLFVHDDTDDVLELMLRRDLRAVTISHVSAKWRQLALSTSELWSHLVLNKMSAAGTFIQRSRQQPVDIIHVSRPSPRSVFHMSLHQALLETAVRWRSVLWESSEDRARHLLSILNRDHTFSHLHTLDIRIDSRESPCIPIIDHKFNRTACFPALTQLYLHEVSPSEIPPSVAHSLRLLSIQFSTVAPSVTTIRSPPLFRMSTFCSFLARTNFLETMIISECTPLMDVYLHTGPGHRAPLVSSSISPIQASSPCSVVQLPHLRRLDWTLAPPKDLWRLFHFLETPNLRELNIWLGKAEDRWTAISNNTIVSMPSSYSLSLQPVNELVTLSNLRELRLFCSDIDGLPLIRSKMQLPALETLEVSFVGPAPTRPLPRSATPTDTPELPSLEYIFRDPRLVKLTHLTISGFMLHFTQVTLMLSYMPELHELVIDSCDGTWRMRAVESCSDRRPTGTCGCKAARATGSTNRCSCANTRWTCPHLERMVLKHCSKLRFVWLRMLLDARQRSTKGRPAALQKRVIRPLPNKRNVRGFSSAPSTPRKQNNSSSSMDYSSYPVVPSPNGSFVAGWNPHEHTDPLKTLGLVVEDCKHISPAELASLEDGTFGPVEIVRTA